MTTTQATTPRETTTARATDLATRRGDDHAGPELLPDDDHAHTGPARRQRAPSPHDDYLGPEPCATTTQAHSPLRHRRGQVPQSPRAVMTRPPNPCATTTWARAPSTTTRAQCPCATRTRPRVPTRLATRPWPHSPRDHHLGPDTLRGDEGAATQPLRDHHDAADPLRSNNDADTQSPRNHHLGPELLRGNDDVDTQPPRDDDTTAAMTSTPPSSRENMHDDGALATTPMFLFFSFSHHSPMPPQPHLIHRTTKRKQGPVCRE